MSIHEDIGYKILQAILLSLLLWLDLYHLPNQEGFEGWLLLIAIYIIGFVLIWVLISLYRGMRK